MSRIEDPIRVLYVDPETATSDGVVTALRRAEDRIDVVTAGDAGEARDRLTDGIDCVVAAGGLPGTDGLAFLSAVCGDDRPCVLVTASDPADCVPVTAAVDDVVRRGPDAGAVLAASVVALVTRYRAGQPGGHRRAELRRVTEDLERLHQATNRLYAAESVEDSYDIAIDTAVDILGMDWCSLSAPADDADLFEIKAISERGTVEVGYRPFGVDEGVAGHVYRTKETHILEEMAESGRARPTDGGIRSALTVPVGDWGVFQAMSSEPAAFDERDLNRAELLCTSLATAIERIQRERTLEAQNERLEEFASIVSHDLRNPLNTLSLSLDLAEETGDASEFDRCRRSVDRMNRLVDVLLALARAGEDISDPDPVELAAAVEAAWETVETREARLVVETDLWLSADRVRLEQLLANLFRNSVEHGTDGDAAGARSADERPTAADLTLRVRDIEGGFVVEDDGPGIPPEERERIFEAGYSTAEDGTGFGLRIVSRIVEAHGWTVRVTDGIDGGAGFEITGITAP